MTEKSMSSQNKPKNQYDAIVVGGGHNGLVAAGYLAKAGLKVLVLEKRGIFGGAAVTEEFYPGFKFSSLAGGAGHLASEVVADLNLRQHGFEILPTDPLLLSLQSDGHHLTLWQDVDRTVQEISKFSQADAEAYPNFVNWMQKISRIVAEMNKITPPDLPEIGLGDLRGYLGFISPILGLGWKHIAQVIRVMPMSVVDLLNEWFESETLKGAIAASAVKYASLGPQEINSTAYMFLYNWSISNTNLFCSSGLVKGGMGALARALAKSAQNLGAEILTASEVVQIQLRDGKAAGVTLANGDQISAKIIISAADVRTTFMKLVDPYYLDPKIIKHVKNIKYNGSMARVHFALDQLPKFASINGKSTLLNGHIQIAPTTTYIQKAYDPTKYGEFSKRPVLDIQIPTLTDPSQAPEGKHVLSVTVKYMPYQLSDGHWDQHRDTIAQLVIKTISAFAPNFDHFIQHTKVITPLDMERVHNLPEGHPAHGEMTLNQFMWMRPIPGYAQYNSPIDGLYLCSVATHPGVGVTGLGGRNAARRILADLK
jgi:phytoene dehydrogenase-like protein